MNVRGTIHIIDDDKATGNSLSMLLQSYGYTTKVYHTAEDFIDSHIESEGPACILLDVRLPGLTGLELIELLPKKNINEPVVMMSGLGDIPTAVRAMKAGAFDFIEKPFNHDCLISTLKLCLEHSAARLAIPSLESTSQKLKLLTRREIQVFDRLVEGKINKVIAVELNVSVRTIEAHRASIMNKVHAKSLSDLVKLSLHSQTN